MRGDLRTTDVRLLTPRNCRLGSDTNGLDENGKKLEGTRWRRPCTPEPGRPAKHPRAAPRLTERNTET
ncbi:hypothetical protein NDU88_004848 [Pleurodeles waltl]|uniref:Uncharacterized protein n=1 Tax=Pleurodeles waltl TaxID=8319 RepID=A0AAV7RJD2_PLEWA|nr:hypothetical protein NDU88_004848 [Pleurodeles waltl]